MADQALKPQDVQLLDVGSVRPDTLHKAEAEFAAAVLVRYHQAKELTEWTPVTRTELADFLGTDPEAEKWARNPFWRPSPRLLVERGYVVGWSQPDEPGIVTEKFLRHLGEPGLWRKELARG